MHDVIQVKQFCTACCKKKTCILLTFKLILFLLIRSAINFLHDLISEWDKIVARPYQEFTRLETHLTKVMTLEHVEEEDKWIGFSSHWLRRAKWVSIICLFTLSTVVPKTCVCLLKTPLLKVFFHLLVCYIYNSTAAVLYSWTTARLGRVGLGMGLTSRLGRA